MSCLLTYNEIQNDIITTKLILKTNATTKRITGNSKIKYKPSCGNKLNQ